MSAERKNFKLAEYKNFKNSRSTKFIKPPFIGLITGSFDILHIGHIKLFEFAKKHCDLLIIGLENDKTISISKGEGKPFFNLAARRKVLEQIYLINGIFVIEDAYNFTDKTANLVLKKVYKQIQPDFIFTNKYADRYLNGKKANAKPLGIKIVEFDYLPKFVFYAETFEDSTF